MTGLSVTCLKKPIVILEMLVQHGLPENFIIHLVYLLLLARDSDKFRTQKIFADFLSPI